MSRQGFLVLHEKKHGPKIYYFSLEDGFLRYYHTSRCVKCVGEVRLSGCKLVVKAQKRNDAMPNSFFLEARKVFVKDRSYTLGNPMRLEMSASSNDDRQEWGKALFSWQRYYWRDPRNNDVFETNQDEHTSRELLEQLLEKYYPALSNQSSSSSSSSSLAKQPLSFLRRNASSLRRSFSLSFPSSASTASSSSSSSSSASSSKAKAPHTSVKDCEKEKVTLSKVDTRATIGGPESAVPHKDPAFYGNQEQQVY
ncbi:TPA: hypothetical protein N0F65_013005 [Lagenidium giganteum]|uniref:PH domain-containing protein n=1 Tax=Lagenidium giganteum TaxID=4803 RepID=A0AAV2YPN0_9STRA|nr:TPA: hypothetical protein N0F65_013005 [Lagenidium giganteum]